MAKAVLFIGWGENVPSNRKKAPKVFEEAMEFNKRMQQSGEIDSFESVFLEPHGGDLAGFTLIRGDREKLARLRMNPEFERIMVRATIILRNVGVIEGFVGEEIQRRIGEWSKSLAELD